MAAIKAGKPRAKAARPPPVPPSKASKAPAPARAAPAARGGRRGGPPPGLARTNKPVAKKTTATAKPAATKPAATKTPAVSPPPGLKQPEPEASVTPLGLKAAPRKIREADELNSLKKKNRLLREKVLTAKDRVKREKDDNKQKSAYEAAKNRAEEMAEKIAMYEKFTKSTPDDKRDILADLMEDGQELLELKTKAEDLEAQIEAHKSKIARANKLVKSSITKLNEVRGSGPGAAAAEAAKKTVMSAFRSTVARRKRTFELLRHAEKEGSLPASLSSRIFEQHEECERFVEDEDALSAELVEVEKKMLEALQKGTENSSKAEFRLVVDDFSDAEKAKMTTLVETDREVEQAMLESHAVAGEAIIARLEVLTDVYERTAQVSFCFALAPVPSP